MMAMLMAMIAMMTTPPQLAMMMAMMVVMAMMIINLPSIELLHWPPQRWQCWWMVMAMMMAMMVMMAMIMVNLPSIELLHHSYTDQLYDGNDDGSICQMAMPIVTPYDPWILFLPKIFCRVFISFFTNSWKTAHLKSIRSVVLYCMCSNWQGIADFSSFFCQLESQTGVGSFLLFGLGWLPQYGHWLESKDQENTICRLFSGFWRGGIVGCWCLWCFWGLILKRCPLDNPWHWSMGHGTLSRGVNWSEREISNFDLWRS